MEETKKMARLQKRVDELEKQLENLRLSRRVLMDLLEHGEREKAQLLKQLDKSNQTIRKYRNLCRNQRVIPSQEVVLIQKYLNKGYLPAQEYVPDDCEDNDGWQ